MIKQLFIFSLFFLNLCSFVQGQSIYEQKLVTDFESKAKKYVRPIGYLQTDKDIYESGEQLWFKFTQLEGQFLTPYLQDSILYLRLVNQINREVFWEEKYALNMGFSNGMVFINGNLTPGIYQLEAYSPSAIYKGMKDFHAFKEIEIRQFVNPEIQIRHNITDQKTAVDLLELIISDKQGNRLPDAQVELALLDENKKLTFQASYQSNQEGRLEIPFTTEGRRWIDLNVVSGNKHVNQRLELKHHKSPIEITLHPESGKLIHHQESWVMLSAGDYWNEDQSRQGVLLKDGKMLQFITMGKDGLGKLKIKPVKGSTYGIVWNETPSDTLRVFDQIKASGVTINLNTQPDTLLMTIQTSWPGQKHFIRLQVRGIVHVFEELMLENISKIKLPLTNIPSGIAEIAVFNSACEPLGERLTWIENNGKLMVEADLKQQEYGSREKVTVTFTVKDANGQALEGIQIGGAVFDKIYQNSGYIRSLYTFAHINTQFGANPKLESILGSSGKIDFKKINSILESSATAQYIWLEKKMESNKSVEHPLSNKLSGQIKYKNSKKENDSNYGLLFRGDNEGNTEFLPLDDGGNFEIHPEELEFGKDEYLYIKALPKVSSEINLTIETPFDNLTPILNTVNFTYSSIDYNSSKQELKLPVFDRNMILLSEFVVRGKRMEQEREKFIGELAEKAKLDFNDDFVCEVANLLNCPVCSHTNIKPVEGKEYMVVSGPKQALEGIAAGTHYIIKKESDIRVSHMIYKYPKYTEEELMKLYNMTRTKGFFKGPGFLQKEYPDLTSKNDPEPDYRSTISWNPFLFTDNEGKVEIEFYTSDIRSIFMGSFEALSSDGKIGKVIFDFTVDGNEL